MSMDEEGNVIRQDTQKVMGALNSEFAQSVYNISLDAMRMAFALAVALAWNTAIKYTIQKFWRFNNDTFLMHLLYAVVITIVFAALILFAQKRLNYVRDGKVNYAVVGM